MKHRNVSLAPCGLLMVLAISGCSDDGASNSALGGSGTGAVGVISGAPGSAAGAIAAPGTAGTLGVSGSGVSGIGAPSGSAGRGAIGVAGSGVGVAGTPGMGMTGSAGRGMMPTAGAGVPPATGGTGVAGMGVAGMPSGTAGAGMMMPMPPSGAACTPPPTAKFQTTTEMGGPNGDYTIIRPTNLGEGGFKHPPIAWGNGVTTVPSFYAAFLNNLASNGFVVIADPGVTVTASIVRQGLEWLIDQNNGSGKFAGKLAVDCAGTIGYSMGGGSAVGAGAHPAVKAVVSFHGLSDAAENAKGPILLTTSEGDTFVTKSGFVAPCYNRSSKQPTILASHPGGDHLDPLGDAGMDAEPGIAWLRYWIYGDQSQKDWFFGDNCKLCNWPDFRRKNHPEWR